MDFLKKVLQAFSGKGAAGIFDFVTSILVIRALGPTEYGKYVMVFLVPNIVTSFGSLGLGPSIMYHINKRSLDRRALLATLLVFGLVLGFIYLTLTLVVLDWIRIDYMRSQISAEVLSVAMLFIPVMILEKFTRSVVRGEYRIMEYSVWVLVVPSLVTLGGAFVALYVLDLGLRGLVWVPVISHSVVVLGLSRLVHSRAPAAVEGQAKFLGREGLRSLMSFGLKGHLGSMIQKSNDKIALLVMTAFLPPAQLGFFNLGVRLVGVVAVPMFALMTALVPKVSRSSIDEIRAFYPKLYRLIFGGLSGLAISASVVVPFVIQIAYGSNFRSVIPIVWILLPGTIMLSIVRMGNTFFTQTGYPLVKSFIRVPGLVVNVVMLILLLPTLGVVGAALAMMASYFSMFVVSLTLVVRRLKVGLSQLLVPRKSELVEFTQKLVALVRERRQQWVS